MKILATRRRRKRTPRYLATPKQSAGYRGWKHVLDLVLYVEFSVGTPNFKFCILGGAGSCSHSIDHGGRLDQKHTLGHSHGRGPCNPDYDRGTNRSPGRRYRRIDDMHRRTRFRKFFAWFQSSFISSSSVHPYKCMRHKVHGQIVWRPTLRGGERG